jgi:zinc-ribbon domain
MRCSRCQYENEAGAKFCPECAHPTGLPPTPPRAPRLDSPDTYTPKYLAEQILTSRGAMEGERKLVTVLFADLKDYETKPERSKMTQAAISIHAK